MLAKWNQKAWLEPEDETSFPITYLSWISLARSPTRGKCKLLWRTLWTLLRKRKRDPPIWSSSPTPEHVSGRWGET